MSRAHNGISAQKGDGCVRKLGGVIGRVNCQLDRIWNHLSSSGDAHLNCGRGHSREGDLGQDGKGKELGSSLPVNSPLWFLLMGSAHPRWGILERKEVLFCLDLV